MNIILIILVFGLIVFFHELGHFLAAKLNKISVTEFSIGMGPAIFSFKKKETKYSIRLLPLGGYCLMLGEDEKLEDEHAFGNQPLLARMMVILAGPFFNFVLAFVFSIVLIHFTGFDTATLYEVSEGGAAYNAGISKEDTILEYNGEKIYTYREVLLERAIGDEKAPVTLLMKRKDGSTYETTVTPAPDENGEYKLGIAGGYAKSPNILKDVQYSWYELRYWVRATGKSLKMIFTGKVNSRSVMGPVGVGEQMNNIIEEVKAESESAKDAILNVLLNMINWCILLSVNLGIMNMLPIPALDGGRFLFLIIEGIRRKKIPEEKEAVVNFIGFVLMIALMVVVFFNDIKNVFF